MTQHLPTGKIDADILGSLLRRYTRLDKRVIVGPGIGEDATVIDMGTTHLLVAKTDPITHVTNALGHYVVNVNANDIAAMGGKPLWFLATVLMPEHSTLEDVDEVFSQISHCCEEMGIQYCGGHTEITSGVTRPVVIGQMLGEAAKGGLKPSSGGRPGDQLLMSKWAAIEATSIMAREKQALLAARFPAAMLKRAQDYLYDPGISVLREALLVTDLEAVHALHDPTEGGIATGVFEMAEASRLGVELYRDRVPVSRETRALCSFFGVDPLGAFASGSLLMAVSAEGAETVKRRLRHEGIACSHIGNLLPPEKGMHLVSAGRSEPLPVYHQDELSKIFG